MNEWMYTSVTVYKPITDIAKVFGCLLFLFQWHSYAGIAGMNHLHIGASHMLQLGSYHWHKSETVEDLKLNIAKVFANSEARFTTFTVKWCSAK